MWRGILYALAAAVCFGVSAPFSKRLLEGGMAPLLLAGLLYLGSGIGPGLRLLARRWRAPGTEIALKRADWRWLLPAIFFGGVCAPALLALGIRAITASQSSLLLSTESAFTAGLAWTLFREPCGRRVVLGMLVILAGSAVLSFQPGRFEFSWGCAAVAGGCFCWALDNNLTKRISGSDPVQITMCKGLLAGPVNLVAALLLGAKLPSPLLVAGTLLLGAFSYGLCLEYMIQSMRRIGAARMGAYFSLAPFVGAGLSILFLGDRPGLQFWAAGLLIAAGLGLFATERDPC